jgi:hypothetical protein
MDTTDTFVKIESIATALGAIVAAFSLVYAALQLRTSRKIARGEFLLHLDELFSLHTEVHQNLRPGGDWANGGRPQSNVEWIAVERYMGLFERVKVLIDDGIIDANTVNRLYGYRITNIVSNAAIQEEKLVKEAGSWKDFIELRQMLGR